MRFISFDTDLSLHNVGHTSANLFLNPCITAETYRYNPINIPQACKGKNVTLELKCIQITPTNIMTWKKYCHLSHEKNHANSLWIHRNGLSPKYFSFFQAACRKFISILELSAYDSKRYSRLMEWQYVPKLASTIFSKCFCGTHQVFTFIASCCRAGCIKGRTKRSFEISCFSLSCQWPYDHYSSATSPYLLLKIFLSLALFCYFWIGTRLVGKRISSFDAKNF